MQVTSWTDIDMVKMVKTWQILNREMAFILKLQKLPYWPMAMLKEKDGLASQASKVACQWEL